MIDTVLMMFITMIATPIAKLSQQNINRLPVAPRLADDIPMIAQLKATALFRVIKPSKLGASMEAMSPPIPLRAKATPRSVYLTSSSRAFMGMIGPRLPTTKPKRVKDKQYVMESWVRVGLICQGIIGNYINTKEVDYSA